MASKNDDSKSRQSSPSHRTTKARRAEIPGEPANRSTGLTVVGIGASAGGLPALNSFFEALSQDTGTAFVVITHLHPAYENQLAELLQKLTAMQARASTMLTCLEA